MEVEKRDGPNDGPRLLSEVRLSSGGVKIVVSDQGDADCKITACVSDQHVESDVCWGTEKLSWPSGWLLQVRAAAPPEPLSRAGDRRPMGGCGVRPGLTHRVARQLHRSSSPVKWHPSAAALKGIGVQVYTGECIAAKGSTKRPAEDGDVHAMPCLNLHAAGPAPHIVPAPCLLTTQAPAVAQPKLPKLGDVGEDAGDFRIYYESRVDPQAPCIVLQLYTCSLTYNPTSHDPTPGPVQCGTTVRGRIGGSYVSADAATPRCASMWLRCRRRSTPSKTTSSLPPTRAGSSTLPS